MPYTHFQGDRPDIAVSGANRLSEIGFARSNEVALADMLASMGWMDMFNVTITGGTALVPTEIQSRNANQIVRTEIAYGTGALANLPITITLSKSLDSGATWLGMRTCSITYDGSGHFVSSDWS